MAKKQTRRSISVSRITYERLRAYCETNGVSMSQFVERRVGDFLGRPDSAPKVQPQIQSAPIAPSASMGPASVPAPARPKPAAVAPASREPTVRDPDVKLTADQIFTF